MGLFSNIISSIGNGLSDVFGGGNDNNDPNKRKQQQASAPVNNANPSGNANLPAVFNPANSQPKAPIFNMPAQNNSNLQAGPVQQPDQPHASIFHDLLHNPVSNGIGDVVKPVASGLAGTALGAARVGTGALEAVTQLPDLALHGGNAAGNALKSLVTGQNVSGVPTYIKQADQITKNIDAPLDAVNRNLDLDSLSLGQPAADIYHPAQIAGNIALVLPGAAEIGANLATKAGQGDSVVTNVLSKIGGQNSNRLNPVNLFRNANEDAGAGEASNVIDDIATKESAPSEAGIKPTEEAPTNAPVGQNTAPTTIPGAPESGVKPVAQPTAPTIPGTPPVEAPVAPIREIPPTAAPVAPEAVAAQDAAQTAVDKTANNIPEPVAAPATSAANVTPAQAESIAAAASPTQDAVNAIPAIQKSVPGYNPPLGKLGKPSVPGTSAVQYSTGEPNLDGIVHDSIVATKNTAKTAGQRADALTKAGISPADAKQIRDIAVNNVDKTTGNISPSGVQQIKDILTKADEPAPVAPETAPATSAAPTETGPGAQPVQTPVGKLGTITHNAVLDGSINTPEGISKAISDTTTAANQEAQAAGDTLPNIIQKGQTIADRMADLKSGGKDAQAKLDAAIADMTPEQQAVYKNYGQELSTLRDRSGLALGNGDLGEFYGPRQAPGSTYSPDLINEMRRGANAESALKAGAIDTSSTPYEHYIQRYADAANAGSQRIVDAIENDAKTGAPTGIKLPDAAKQQMEESLKEITAQKDEASRLLHEGDVEGANKLSTQVGKSIDKVFNNAADAIPGSGSARREAINQLNSIRDPYKQSLMQFLSLSNVVNRVADQGGKVVALAKRPLENVVAKASEGKFTRIAEKAKTEVNPLNNDKAMTQAAKEMSSGSNGRQMAANFRTTMSQAGSGRNPLVKGLAKVYALPKAANAAATQAGDLVNSNIADALRLGASKPEAQGLKTVAEYKKYFGDYMKTDDFKQNLAKTSRENNAQIGLSGGKDDNMASGGKISKAISKNLDNGFKNHLAEKLHLNPDGAISQNVNDTIKGNVTGYAGVGSRILGYAKDAALPFGKLRSIAKEAASGDPVAVAKAQQAYGKAIANTVSTYGTGAAAYAALKSKGLGNVVGYTGAQPTPGSSQSAYNKANGVPADRWYLNLGGKRVYLNATRTFNVPGLAADLAGSAATSKNGASAVGNALTQVYNQAGASSLPQTVVNATNYAADPNGKTATGKYASEQLQQTAAPSTGILNNIANWTDPNTRSAKNFVNDIKSNVPGLRGQVPLSKDSQGNAIPNARQVSGGSSVLSIGSNINSPKVQAGDPLGTEVNRLQKLTGDVFPTASDKNASSGDAQKMANLLLSNPEYTSSNDKDKAALLKGVLAGTSTKGINSTLSDADKQALLSTKLLGTDKSKVWLQDNNNAASYYNAEYDNKTANKTLTTDDQDTSTAYSGSGGTLKVRTLVAKTNQENNVSQGLVELYDNTSKSDYEKMSGADKASLTQYANELNKNGVVDKFGVSSGTSGGAKKSLGEAVTLTAKSGSTGLTAGTAKYSAPTLKAYAASTAKNGNPFVHSISASAGVK